MQQGLGAGAGSISMGRDVGDKANAREKGRAHRHDVRPAGELAAGDR